MHRRPFVHVSLPALFVLVAIAGAPARADAPVEDKAAKKLDLVWTHPDFAAAGLKSIAMLPAASYTNDAKIEKEVENAWGVAFRPSGYRWYSATLTKELVRRALGNDSMLTAVRTKLLKDPRVDSLSARALCRALRVTAVLSVRAEQWEQTQVEWNQTGEPWTTVQLKAAIVDSAGRLLWTASGGETGKGPLHTASENNVIGVKSSGLNLQAVTAEGGAPSFEEVLLRLFGRWVQRLPAKAEAPTAAPSSPGGS